MPLDELIAFALGFVFGMTMSSRSFVPLGRSDFLALAVEVDAFFGAEVFAGLMEADFGPDKGATGLVASACVEPIPCVSPLNFFDAPLSLLPFPFTCK